MPTEAILSNSTRKLLRFEITKTLIAPLKNWIYCVTLYNFRYTVVPPGCTQQDRETNDPLYAVELHLLSLGLSNASAVPFFVVRIYYLRDERAGD